MLCRWAVKACILVMYFRLTMGRLENIAIKLLACYVAFGFVFMEIFYLGVWCRPFHNYWAVPTPNEQCNAATNHLITNAVFNLSSDSILLCLTLPMFIRSKLPKRKKVALVCVFGLGLFVILCAILNKYYSFTEPFGDYWTFWVRISCSSYRQPQFANVGQYVRESSTALLVANLPYIWTLLRRVFKFQFLESTVAQSRTDTHFSRTRREKTEPFSPGIDPESGRQLSDDQHPSVMNTPGKDDPDLQFLTTPASFANSWASRDSNNPPTPPKCVMRDTLSDRHYLY